jgi:hypothetical protein
MELKEVVWYITNKPYFKIFVLNNGRRVKTFSQLSASTVKGEDVFLIAKGLKAAWFKPDEPIIDGLKFITFVDINNAIPLKIVSETVYESGEYFIKEIKRQTITKAGEPSKDGKPLRTVEISFPPTLLYQKVEASFVKQIMSEPPNKFEELKWVFIAGILVFGFIAWQLLSSGIIGGK